MTGSQGCAARVSMSIWSWRSFLGSLYGGTGPSMMYEPTAGMGVNVDHGVKLR